MCFPSPPLTSVPSSRNKSAHIEDFVFQRLVFPVFTSPTRIASAFPFVVTNASANRFPSRENAAPSNDPSPSPIDFSFLPEGKLQRNARPSLPQLKRVFPSGD